MRSVAYTVTTKMRIFWSMLARMNMVLPCII